MRDGKIFSLEELAIDYTECPNCGSDIILWLQMAACCKCYECDSIFGAEDEIEECHEQNIDPN
jgi:uncharacterized protein involved in tolerance to divalent cations